MWSSWQRLFLWYWLQILLVVLCCQSLPNSPKSATDIQNLVLVFMQRKHFEACHYYVIRFCLSLHISFWPERWGHKSQKIQTDHLRSEINAVQQYCGLKCSEDVVCICTRKSWLWEESTNATLSLPTRRAQYTGVWSYYFHFNVNEVFFFRQDCRDQWPLLLK